MSRWRWRSCYRWWLLDSYLVLIHVSSGMLVFHRSRNRQMMGNVGVGLFRGGKAACMSDISASRGQMCRRLPITLGLNGTEYVSPLQFMQQQAEHSTILLFLIMRLDHDKMSWRLCRVHPYEAEPRCIPVIGWVRSDNINDKIMDLKFGNVCIKPILHRQYLHVISILNEYWRSASVYPKMTPIPVQCIYGHSVNPKCHS